MFFGGNKIVVTSKYVLAQVMQLKSKVYYVDCKFKKTLKISEW